MTLKPDDDNDDDDDDDDGDDDYDDDNDGWSHLSLPIKECPGKPASGSPATR